MFEVRPPTTFWCSPKGHASPLLYSVFKAVGVVSDENAKQLMSRYRAGMVAPEEPILRILLLCKWCKIP